MTLKFEIKQKDFSVLEINGGDYYYIPALACFLKYTSEAKYVEETDANVLTELKAAINSFCSRQIFTEV